MGWTAEETDSEVRLIMPGAQAGRNLIDDVLGGVENDNDADTSAEGSSASFRLEHQLRDFLAENLDVVSVGGQHLSLYVDPTGRDGVEYHTPVGSIDILAVSVAGAFYVFELKRASSPDRALGQLARYMGWVKQTIGKDREVHGVIVARNINDRLKYAISVVPNVSLFEYEVKFQLRPAHLLT